MFIESTPVAPRPASVNSIPTLLSMFQNEWDALVLESFKLKQAYHQTRQELSNALYENDAAKRVIARLVQERDEARAQLAQSAGAAPKKEVAGDGMDVDEAVPGDVLETITNVAST